MHIMYALKNPKKKPKILSNVPKPEYVIALLIDLLIKRITKITTTNKLIPRKISKIYSLSNKSSTYGFAFGNKNRVITYASNHLEAESILNKKPFLVHSNNVHRVINK